MSNAVKGTHETHLERARNILDAIIEGKTRLGDGSTGVPTGRLRDTMLKRAVEAIECDRRDERIGSEAV